MLRYKALFAAVARHVQLANRNSECDDFSSLTLYHHHISSADALLRLAEKEITGKTRGATSLRGLTKRLASLEG